MWFCVGNYFCTFGPNLVQNGPKMGFSSFSQDFIITFPKFFNMKVKMVSSEHVHLCWKLVWLNLTQFGSKIAQNGGFKFSRFNFPLFFAWILRSEHVHVLEIISWRPRGSAASLENGSPLWAYPPLGRYYIFSPPPQRSWNADPPSPFSRVTTCDNYQK